MMEIQVKCMTMIGGLFVLKNFILAFVGFFRTW